MKSRLRTIFISSIVTISAFISVGYVACNRDKCKTLVCANGGICNLGTCICPSGYEGAQCETVSRNKFLGIWSVFEKGSISNAAQYTVTISAFDDPGNTDPSNVMIHPFYNYFKTNVKAYVVRDTMFIPNQEYEGKLLFGIGTIYSTSTYGQYAAMSVRYEIIDTATQVVNDFGYNSVVDGSDASQWNK
jgi:hypothetical protein